ncbi:MAG: conjugal transfer protein TraH [bacterium]
MYSIRLKIASVVLSFFMVFTSTAGIVGWYRTPYAYAGINSFVSAGLSGANSVSNVEGSGEYHTQGENIYTLGSAEVRFNTVGQNLQLFTISPPNFSIGCSGIDATFGAFAMLGSNLMKALQSIIQSGQVLVFAFNMVLGVLCKQCEHIMNQIESIANKLNGLNFHSCQAAQAMGNLAGAEIGGMLNKSGVAGATNAFADSVSSTLGSVSSSIGTFVNTINGAASGNCQPVTANGPMGNLGYANCGEAAAVNQFQYGSMLRYALSQAHIGLIAGTMPGSGGANDMIGILRGTFIGDVVGFPSTGKSGEPVIRLFSPVSSQGGNNTPPSSIANLMYAFMYGTQTVASVTINYPSSTYPVTTAGLTLKQVEGGPQTECFPGFYSFFQYYLQQVESSYFGTISPTSITGVCGTSKSITPLTGSQLDNFVTNNPLPVIMIAKLAYVNDDPAIINEEAKALAAGYAYNMFSDMMRAVENNVMAAKNVDQKSKKIAWDLYTNRVRSIAAGFQKQYMDEVNNTKAQEAALTYYQNINKAWVSSLSQFGLSGAYNYNP